MFHSPSMESRQGFPFVENGINSLSLRPFPFSKTAFLQGEGNTGVLVSLWYL